MSSLFVPAFSPALLAKTAGWFLAFFLARSTGFAGVFILFTICWLIFTVGLRDEQRKPNEQSAYAAFNPGCRPIQGTLRAEHLEAEIRHQTFVASPEDSEASEDDDDVRSQVDPAPKKRRQKPNELCDCGSKKKFKKCCGDTAWQIKHAENSAGGVYWDSD
eukprot:TRINITY_DN2042_c0_g1_i2.p1 TRINITY_DN2042_c0_g1~~TRINITY_DN2042_c0_g1_i2.p1  ORF type:complete len:161 (-),score=26.13 TRINITY_DN2042_c0_g1_i2:21-503(-)